MGRKLLGLERSLEFLQTGITEGRFQHEGKHDSEKHFLDSLASTGDNSGEHFCSRIIGIPSGPVALEASNLEKMEAIFLTEKSTDFSSTSVLESKSGKGTPSSLILKFAAQILVKSSALSLAEVITSGPLNSGGIGAVSLLSTCL